MINYLNRYILSLFLFLTSVSAYAALSEEKSIVVVIPSYNNKDWYHFNVSSVLSQNYKNYRVIYIDDNSPDGTGKLVEDYLSKYDYENKVTLIQNSERVGAMANIYKAIWMCAPSDIIVTVDGDDWLDNEEVLAKVNEIYSDGYIWLTYGQYRTYPTGLEGGAAKIPSHVIADNGFRDYDWVTTHLRTFYAGLFQNIEKEDLQYQGNFYPAAPDLAYMFPMLEMAGNHSLFVPDVLYVYNVATPISENKIYLELIRFLDGEIRSRERYLPIETPY